MAEMTDAMNKPAVFLLNQAPPRRGEREPPCVLEAIEALRRRGMVLAPVGLRSRAAYQTAVARGLTAPEAMPGSAAAREIELLWEHMEQTLWPARPAGRLPEARFRQLMPTAAMARQAVAAASAVGAAAE